MFENGASSEKIGYTAFQMSNWLGMASFEIEWALKKQERGSKIDETATNKLNLKSKTNG